MKAKDVAIRGAKVAYRFISNKKFPPPECDVDRNSSNSKIYELLTADRPCMISRFGTTELNCINNYLCVISKRNYIKKIADYVFGCTHTPWWNEDHFNYMNIYSGIFPPGIKTSEKFSQRYLADIPLIDLLGAFQYYEKFMPLNDEVVKVQLEVLYPFFVDKPWTKAIEGKKVLVIHPFDETIKRQYKNRKKLFENPDVLPEFELITLKAVQSVAGSNVPFEDWFSALHYMERLIENIEFDVSIIGCGAYGLPLAAHVKRLGKKAVHLGGGTQLLFGIKGKRWESQYEEVLKYRQGQIININYSSLFNDNWVYPSVSEKPANANKVENACYW